MKKKVFNFRFFPILSAAISLGALTCLLANLKALLVTIYVLCSLSFSVFVVAVLRGKSKKIFLSLAACLLAFCSVSLIAVGQATQTENDVFVDDAIIRFEVQRYECEYGTVYGRATTLEDGKVFENAYMTVEYPDTGKGLTTGDVVDFLGSITPQRLFTEDGTLDFGYYNSDLRYRAEMKTLYAVSDGARVSVFDSVRSAVQQKIESLFTGDNRALVLALVVGDKSVISSDLKDNFSDSGLSHILAISGLHFSVFSGALLLLMKKIKANKVVTDVVVVAVSLCYAAICGFSPSVMRAFIMLCTLLLAHLTGRKYDLLSSCCFASSVILLISPLRILSPSYLMSFFAVLGIAFLQKPIVRFLSEKARMPQAVSDFLSVSLAANVGIFPFSAVFFGKISVLFLVSNAFVLPLMSVGYIAIIITVILGFIGLPVTFLANAFLWLVSSVANAVGSISFASVTVGVPTVLVCTLYYFAVIILSDFFLPWQKIRKMRKSPPKKLNV